MWRFRLDAGQPRLEEFLMTLGPVEVQPDVGHGGEFDLSGLYRSVGIVVMTDCRLPAHGGCIVEYLLPQNQLIVEEQAEAVSPRCGVRGCRGRAVSASDGGDDPVLVAVEVGGQRLGRDGAEWGRNGHDDLGVDIAHFGARAGLAGHQLHHHITGVAGLGQIDQGLKGVIDGFCGAGDCQCTGMQAFGCVQVLNRIDDQCAAGYGDDQCLQLIGFVEILDQHAQIGTETDLVVHQRIDFFRSEYNRGIVDAADIDLQRADLRTERLSVEDPKADTGIELAESILLRREPQQALRDVVYRNSLGRGDRLSVQRQPARIGQPRDFDRRDCIPVDIGETKIADAEGVCRILVERNCRIEGNRCVVDRGDVEKNLHLCRAAGAIRHAIDKAILAVEIGLRCIDETTVCSERDRAMRGFGNQSHLQLIPVDIAVVGKNARGGVDGQRLVLGGVVAVSVADNGVIDGGDHNRHEGRGTIAATVFDRVFEGVDADKIRRGTVAEPPVAEITDLSAIFRRCREREDNRRGVA